MSMREQQRNLETVVMEVIRRHVDSDVPEKEKEDAFVGEDRTYLPLMTMATSFCVYVATHLGLTIMSINHHYGEWTFDGVLHHAYLSTCVFLKNGVSIQEMEDFMKNDKEWEPYALYDQGYFTVHLQPDQEE